MAVTVTEKGNYIEIDRGEVSRRFVVKPFDVKICGSEIIELGDGLKNHWDFNVADLTGWTYSDIYDLKDQLYALNNSYEVNATITAQIGEVEISNDTGNPVPTIIVGANNITEVLISQTNTTTLLLASNVNRKELTVYNNSNSLLYVSYVNPATIGRGEYLKPQDILRDRTYYGSVYGIWAASGAGNAQVREIYQ